MGHVKHGVTRDDDGVGPTATATEEIAHVRARFGVDPATARLALDDAWTAPVTMEEDESELLDAVADCLSVGLPMEAALASWRSGSLEASDEDQEEDDEDDEDDAKTGVYHPPAPASGR
jgi:hypothetical protein